ncbi:MAG: ABC transporter substrate-binding protein [Rubrivivax sp.]|nr:ABC transporter substrate-binding protein [Rubrivivax sp.]
MRVVTLSPSLTETVCALGACSRLVGVDRYSNWPAEVKALPQLGGLEDTQIERIVALKPDVVLAAASIRAIDRLEALGLRVLALEAQAYADVPRVIGRVAQALGAPAAGAALWQRQQARLQAAAERVPAALRGRKVYLEVASAPYAAGEASFVGEVLARLGLGNVVPAALGPFPKLNPEFVVRAQPQLMMGSARAVAEMAQRPGWAGLAALRDRQTCGFEASAWDTLVRAGPRLADAAEAIADCLVKLEPR